MYNSKNPQSKKLLIIGGVFAVFVIVAIVLAIINALKSASLEILVAPSFADVELDGRHFKTDQTIKYYPGEYKVTVSADGFTSQELDLTLVAGQTSYLYLYLIPEDGSFNFYNENPEEDNLFQEVMSHIYLAESEEFLAKYPIASILPYDHYTQNEFFEPTGYRIDYGHFDACKSPFCLQVTSYTQSGLADAKAYIQENGFNPDDYEILFKYTPIEKPSPSDFPPNIRQILEAAGYFN